MGALGTPGGEFRLIADPSSLDGELIRFVLDHYQIFYQQLPRGVLLARASTASHRRPPSAALLFNETVALSHPAEVVNYFESQMPAPKRLVPVRQTEAADLENHWKLYYHTFNAAVCGWLYAHLIPQKAALLEAFNRQVQTPEKLATTLLFPLIGKRLEKRHRLEPGRAEEALGIIRKGYDRLDRRLEDGRRFLLGERISLADIVFAVLAAPTVLPDGFQGPNPRGTQVPPKMQHVVKEFRERPAGQLALRLYQSHGQGQER